MLWFWHRGNLKAVKIRTRLPGQDCCEELTQSHLGEGDTEVPPWHLPRWFFTLPSLTYKFHTISSMVVSSQSDSNVEIQPNCFLIKLFMYVYFKIFQNIPVSKIWIWRELSLWGLQSRNIDANVMRTFSGTHYFNVFIFGKAHQHAK